MSLRRIRAIRLRCGRHPRRDNSWCAHESPIRIDRGEVRTVAKQGDQRHVELASRAKPRGSRAKEGLHLTTGCTSGGGVG